MVGEGKYNLNDVKEITVSDSYLGMDTHIKAYQNEEELEDCTTRQYIDTFLLKCGCLPFSIWTSKKVSNEKMKLISIV